MNEPTRHVRSYRRHRTVLVAAIVAATLAVGATAWAGVQTASMPAAKPTQPQASADLKMGQSSTTPPSLAPAEASTPVNSTPNPSPAAASQVPAAAATEGKSGQEQARIHQPVSPPVPLNATVTLAKGGKIRIASIESAQGEARGPGEVAGPSIRFQVAIDNPTENAIPTTNLLVNVESGAEKKPALQLSGPGVVEFSGSVGPRSSASAVYVFNVPLAERDLLRILVDYGLSDPIAVFEGSATKAGA